MASSPERYTTIVSVLALLAMGCGDTTTALELNLKLTPSVFATTQTARIIVSSADGRSFQPMTTRTVEKGLSVRNVDVDGDGAVDIVVDFSQEYPFDLQNRFQLRPGPLKDAINLRLGVEIYDHLQNLVARLGGPDATNGRVPGLLTPGQVSRVDDLAPDCVAGCSSATLRLDTSVAQSITFGGATLDAIAAGNLTGQMPARADLVLASAHEARGSQPNTGRVEIHFGGTTLRVETDVTILGAAAGAQAGRALATGDLDGDGHDDLVIGSPGTQSARGVVTVLYGMAMWPAVVDLAALPGDAAEVSGTVEGEELGGSLAIIDLDGDGKLEVLAGAVGASTVYVLDSETLVRGNRRQVSTRAVVGASGSAFGRAMATRGSLIAIAAPNESVDDGVGAVYLLRNDEVAGRRDTSGLPRLIGRGGGFGTSLAFADVDGTGEVSMVVGAPKDGSGTVFVAPVAMLNGDRHVSGDERSVRTLAPLGELGSAIGSLPWPLGDALVLGAPSPLPSEAPGAGALFVLRGPTLRTLPGLRLEADGRPAATMLSGERPGDGLGSQIVVADFNQDGRLDVVVAASKVKTVYLLPGPLL